METDIRDLALAHAEVAIDVLAEIMTNRDAPAAARISAAKAILDRGLGKPTTQKAEPKSREAPIIGFERVIIDPRKPGLDTLAPIDRSESRPYRGTIRPANDQFPREDQADPDQQIEDQPQPAQPAAGDYGDYTMTGGDGWG